MEKEHPIHRLMDLSLDHIVDMVDTSKIIGQPIILDSNRFIIPISKVSFGFGVGGSEFKNQDNKKNELPFGGGSGGGVSISPYSFIIVDHNSISLINAEKEETLVEKIIDIFANKQNNNKS